MDLLINLQIDWWPEYFKKWIPGTVHPGMTYLSYKLQLAFLTCFKGMCRQVAVEYIHCPWRQPECPAKSSKSQAEEMASKKVKTMNHNVFNQSHLLDIVVFSYLFGSHGFVWQLDVIASCQRTILPKTQALTHRSWYCFTALSRAAFSTVLFSTGPPLPPPMNMFGSVDDLRILNRKLSPKKKWNVFTCCSCFFSDRWYWTWFNTGENDTTSDHLHRRLHDPSAVLGDVWFLAHHPTIWTIENSIFLS